jgi:hypothetical protein
MKKEQTNEHKETEIGNRININLVNMGTVNKNRVTIEKGEYKLILYFSYETIVSFESWGRNYEHYKKATIENLWGPTTEKLLNECEPDKTKRLNEEEFNKVLGVALTIFGSG